MSQESKQKAKRIRAKARSNKRVKPTQERLRLAVQKTGKNIYAQLIDDEKAITLAFASSIDKELNLKHGGNCQAAEEVGKLIAKRIKAKKIKKVVFDRGGNLYHGRIKALAEAARKEGLEF